jgi:hypothetical protein
MPVFMPALIKMANRGTEPSAPGRKITQSRLENDNRTSAALPGGKVPSTIPLPEKRLALPRFALYPDRMFARSLLVFATIFAVAGCQAPYKKKDDEDKKPLKDQSADTNFQAFLGRLRIAVAKHDQATLVSMMTSNFGYRWDAAPAGETVFSYWDQNNVWPELSAILLEKFAPHGVFMVAPAQFLLADNYQGYRAGMRTVGGSWKFAYFISGQEP